ncbi:hypothetical protein [Peribacillus kribbensis]|uniref:hypothetical protein n=1 Tax=Peribacillus kribbensis TaxID=356658 RepID=UPI0012DEEBDA|nr:hypothetical protein [Peribacillus kribbensis]
MQITLFKNNQHITKQVSGYGTEDYGLSPVQMNTEAFSLTLNLTLEDEELADVLTNDDISELVEEMEKILNLSIEEGEGKEEFFLVK